MRSFEDLTGRRFGRLVVQSRESSPKRGNIVWRCLCDCGSITNVKSPKLKSGLTISCGCWGREKRIAAKTKHGFTGSPEHVAWVNMLQRCSNPNSADYIRYGGRGIRVCERWLEFANFLADMGERPAGMTLERENVNGDYEPSNCKWADRQIQANNRRSNRLITIDGRTQTIAQWAAETGVKAGTIAWRIRNGYGAADAIKP